jgi:transcriptional regulator with XRE-family HTH domain
MFETQRLIEGGDMARITIRPGLLEELREEANITSDAALADRIGVGRATLARVKSGEQDPSTAFITAICVAFGRSLADVAVVADAVAA